MIVGLYLPILAIDTNNSKFEYLEGNCKISCIILFYFFWSVTRYIQVLFLLKFFNDPPKQNSWAATEHLYMVDHVCNYSKTNYES